MKTQPPRRIRCVIYTRVSTDHVGRYREVLLRRAVARHGDRHRIRADRF